MTSVTVAWVTGASAELRTAAGWSGAWQHEQPMRLGAPDPAPRRSDFARVQTPQSNCAKWRRIAERLGETYAGLRLRQSVVDRACLFAYAELTTSSGSNFVPADTGFDHLWAWPWANGAIDPALPPRLHASFGDWTIRCGLAGHRERCALIHETSALAMQGESPAVLTTAMAPAAAKVTTHFVIDTISGHSHLLWRVFVAASPGAEPTRTDLVRFSAGPLTGAKRFDGCSSAGCLMEADMTTSARVATRLWEGVSGDITLNPGANQALTAVVPANGVRAGLAELARLKRAEEKQLARN
jgi:invasion protein IalB